MTDFPALIGALSDLEVDYIIVGGLAATVHGFSRLTQDNDVVYARVEENLETALAPHRPYPRGSSPSVSPNYVIHTHKRALRTAPAPHIFGAWIAPT